MQRPCARDDGDSDRHINSFLPAIEAADAREIRASLVHVCTNEENTDIEHSMVIIKHEAIIIVRDMSIMV